MSERLQQQVSISHSHSHSTNRERKKQSFFHQTRRSKRFNLTLFNFPFFLPLSIEIRYGVVFFLLKFRFLNCGFNFLRSFWFKWFFFDNVYVEVANVQSFLCLKLWGCSGTEFDENFGSQFFFSFRFCTRISSMSWAAPDELLLSTSLATYLDSNLSLSSSLIFFVHVHADLFWKELLVLNFYVFFFHDSVCLVLWWKTDYG